jgi:hypothetical protein
MTNTVRFVRRNPTIILGDSQVQVLSLTLKVNNIVDRQFGYATEGSMIKRSPAQSSGGWLQQPCCQALQRASNVLFLCQIQRFRDLLMHAKERHKGVLDCEKFHGSHRLLGKN